MEHTYIDIYTCSYRCTVMYSADGHLYVKCYFTPYIWSHLQENNTLYYWSVEDPLDGNLIFNLFVFCYHQLKVSEFFKWFFVLYICYYLIALYIYRRLHRLSTWSLVAESCSNSTSVVLDSGGGKMVSAWYVSKSLHVSQWKKSIDMKTFSYMDRKM